MRSPLMSPVPACLRRFAVVALLLSVVLPGSAEAQDSTAAAEPEQLRVMTWNIWHGGREDGPLAGPAKVAQVIRESGADLVAMQETYGSGELISDALGFHFQPRGTNVSIHSRFPILEDLSVHDEFQCVGALVELPDQRRVAFYSIWLPYSAEIWVEGTRDNSDPASVEAACAASAKSLGKLWGAVRARLAAPEYEGVPVVIAGDFNSMSHIDYGHVGVDQHGVVVDFPTSHILMDGGLIDSYRAVHPDIDRQRDATWTPRFPRQEQDRIDYIYASPTLKPIDSHIVRDLKDGFPSDHAALVTTYVPRKAEASAGRSIKALSYNIKHGLGMAGQLDLARAAAVIQEHGADVVALQEVDLAAKRSGYTNQVNGLARRLQMHPAFGSFMPYQGGHYGMAMLSRFPIVRTTSLRLPEGNEPRVALVCEIVEPTGQHFLAVNVHFDWVKDDTFRLAQAQVVADYLDAATLPFLLMGDFNDVPESNTLGLFRQVATEAAKPAERSKTFPANDPTKEIDFVFYSSNGRWEAAGARVLDEPAASDHRPVAADLVLRPARR